MQPLKPSVVLWYVYPSPLVSSGEAVEPGEEESPAGLWEEAQKDNQGMERKVPVFLPVEVINRSGASRTMLLLCEEDNA